MSRLNPIGTWKKFTRSSPSHTTGSLRHLCASSSVSRLFSFLLPSSSPLPHPFLFSACPRSLSVQRLTSGSLLWARSLSAPPQEYPLWNGIESVTGAEGSRMVTCLKSTVVSMSPSIRNISCVILDLDGTLINTEGIVDDVLKVFLIKYGKKWDGRGTLNRVGKTQAEAASAIIEDYGLPCSVEEFMVEIAPYFTECWSKVKALPGAHRLVRHLYYHGVRIALASNSSRTEIERKISYHNGWKESFSIVIGGDEVQEGKPSPYIFIEAAKRLNADPSRCLVVEDSVPGIKAGKAAGMKVVAVPSIPKQTHLYNIADEIINSLLDLQLEKWGLPEFEDWVEGTLPIDPWYIGGPVIKGFGRGSKVLGIPTANLSPDGFSDILSLHTSGVYFGWAGLSTRGIYKMVMSVGWNPYFNNAEKTVEPWLLHDFDDDFYGEELRLAVVGYIRPQANFSSLDALIERIHKDKEIAEKALDLSIYSSYKDAPYIVTSLADHCQ